VFVDKTIASHTVVKHGSIDGQRLQCRYVRPSSVSYTAKTGVVTKVALQSTLDREQVLHCLDTASIACVYWGRRLRDRRLALGIRVLL
jgi:hypothetical protein